MRNALICLSLLMVHSVALAYIGPGLGAGAIGVILGIFGSILLALFAIFWYPLKRLLKKKSRKSDPGTRDKEKPQPERDA